MKKKQLNKSVKFVTGINLEKTAPTTMSVSSVPECLVWKKADVNKIYWSTIQVLIREHLAVSLCSAQWETIQTSKLKTGTLSLSVSSSWTFLPICVSPPSNNGYDHEFKAANKVYTVKLL